MFKQILLTVCLIGFMVNSAFAIETENLRTNFGFRVCAEDSIEMVECISSKETGEIHSCVALKDSCLTPKEFKNHLDIEVAAAQDAQMKEDMTMAAVMALPPLALYKGAQYAGRLTLKSFIAMLKWSKPIQKAAPVVARPGIMTKVLDGTIVVLNAPGKGALAGYGMLTAMLGGGGLVMLKKASDYGLDFVRLSLTDPKSVSTEMANYIESQVKVELTSNEPVFLILSSDDNETTNEIQRELKALIQRIWDLSKT